MIIGSLRLIISHCVEKRSWRITAGPRFTLQNNVIIELEDLMLFIWTKTRHGQNSNETRMHYSRMLTDRYSDRYQMSVPGTRILSGPMFLPGGFCSGGGSLSRGFSLSGGSPSLFSLWKDKQVWKHYLPLRSVTTHSPFLTMLFVCTI